MSNIAFISDTAYMSKAYAIGEQIVQEEKFLFEVTGTNLPLTDEGSACVYFMQKVNDGVIAEQAWKQTCSFFNFIKAKNKT